MKNPLRTMFGALALSAMFALGACASKDNADEAKAATPVAATAPAAPAATTSAPAPAQAALVPPPVTVTVSQETKTMNCTVAGLAADGRTLSQARRLIATDKVTINGSKVALGAGNSYYKLCQGPTMEQQLATANAAVARLTEQLVARTDNRDEWRAEALASRETNATLQADLVKANSLDLGSLLVGLVLGLLIMLGVLIWNATRPIKSVRNTPDQRSDDPHEPRRAEPIRP